jgi:hypothetical protein
MLYDYRSNRLLSGVRSESATVEQCASKEQQWTRWYDRTGCILSRKLPVLVITARIVL